MKKKQSGHARLVCMCVCVCVLSGVEVVVELWVLRPLPVRPGQSSYRLLAVLQEDFPAQGSSV